MPTLPQVTGRTENALRALLQRQLDGTRIHGDLAWVALNRADSTPDRAGLVDRLVVETRRPVAEVQDALARLRSEGLLDAEHAVTPEGAAELAAGRARVGVAVSGLLDGIEPRDLDTTLRVLEAVRVRAEEQLAS